MSESGDAAAAGSQNGDENNGVDHNADAALGEAGGSAEPSPMDEDPEIEAIKAKMKEMEDEAEKIRSLQSSIEKQMNSSVSSSSSAIGSPSFPSIDEKIEMDLRSVYVGNVDYGATAQELEAHFHGCGAINRVTIQCDKFSGHPKGFAYIEFADKESVDNAVALDESLFRGRQIKVVQKRTNKPGISSTNRSQRRGRPRGRFSSFRPRGRAMYSRRRTSSYYAPY